MGVAPQADVARAGDPRSDLTDLHIVSYGGPDVGILTAAGKCRKVTYGFVSLDSIPLEPHFRAVRQGGLLPDFMELDEGAFYLGLMAAAHRVPFYPTRAGLGSAMLSENPELRTVTSPYGDGEKLVAIPAFDMDAVLLHMNRADERQRSVPRPRPLLRRSVRDGRHEDLHVGGEDHRHRGLSP